MIYYLGDLFAGPNVSFKRIESNIIYVSYKYISNFSWFQSNIIQGTLEKMLSIMLTLASSGGHDSEEAPHWMVNSVLSALWA